jgi:phosphoribosylaminoimidazole-succinocarboxamide synthase
MLTADRFLRSGKVRDLYRIDDERLAMVASDRISAFDVVLPTPILDKGRVLTGLSRFWFGSTTSIVPNHLLGTDVAGTPELAELGSIDELRGRTMICRTAAVLPIEIVVRGYIAGSGWKEYLRTGSVCGIPLPPMLRESQRLPEPILTPATKADQGEHDMNIDLQSMIDRLAAWAPDGGGDPLGERAARDLAARIRAVALDLYDLGASRCARAGIILADTKFEMGLIDGQLTLVDEVLTPDSSRFWDAAAYAPGGPQASFDKQFVRDWLEGQPWDKREPGPQLPEAVVAGTRARYVEAFERITGAGFQRYLEEDVIAP